MCEQHIIGTEFKTFLNNIIWNQCLSPTEFEDKWNSLIKEFGMEDNEWLTTIYNMRSLWIPAFFKDYSLSGLMKTSSLSESQNSFFKNFVSHNSNLQEFILKFDNAMDKQRNGQATNDFNSVTAHIKTITPSRFEEQVAEHYTLKMFKIIQDEIHDSVWTCSPSPGINYSSNGVELSVVIEKPFGGKVKGKSSFLILNSSNNVKKEFRYKVCN